MNFSGITATRRSTSRSRAAEKSSPKVAERKATPKSTRKTPTRASARSNANYPLRNKVPIDATEVPIKRSQSNASMSSKKSTGGGWFSKCQIV